MSTERGSVTSGICFASQQSAVFDQDFVDELNRVSNRTLEVLSAGHETDARQLSGELQEKLVFLEEVNDIESSRFLRVLLGLLNHTVPKEASKLEGMYSAAVDRIFNQIAGSSWKLLEEGKSERPGFGGEEPQFSTWDDVLNGKAAKGESPSGPRDASYYRLLRVQSNAAPAEIKASYRRLALELHPDVNSAADATERFAEISAAYDVLSDPTSRNLYDKYGLDMASREGAQAGRGNARDAWNEFKPYKRENKRTRARDAVRTQSAASPAQETSESEESRVPELGDVVEYPLRDVEAADFADGRSHGVGLLVGRNLDRGDAAKLPESQLSLCEVEPLRQEEPNSSRWIPDELGVSSFAKLEDMRLVPVADFDSRHDIWTIEADLSPGCGGPPLPEEIIL